jgi:hypothetical protein
LADAASRQDALAASQAANKRLSDDALRTGSELARGGVALRVAEAELRALRHLKVKHTRERGAKGLRARSRHASTCKTALGGALETAARALSRY